MQGEQNIFSSPQGGWLSNSIGHGPNSVRQFIWHLKSRFDGPASYRNSVDRTRDGERTTNFAGVKR